MDSTPNIEKILSALKTHPWTKGKSFKEEDGVRKYDTISILLLQAGVSDKDIPTLSMGNTWQRYGEVLAREYGLKDNTDYYLVLIAGDSSVSASDMLNRVEGVLKGDLNAIAPFYRNWIAGLLANRDKQIAESKQATKTTLMENKYYSPEKLYDVRWLEKRIEVLKHDGQRCQGVDESGKQCEKRSQNCDSLEIHHRNYTISRETGNPWDEPLENLITLCREHHEQERNANLSQAANDVCSALKTSNWMVRHRKLLARCISEKIVSPEELCRFIEERMRNQLPPK